MKKIIILVIIIAAAVLTLPLPKKYDKVLQGFDTQTGEEVAITINVTDYNYLVREDKLKGKFYISPYALDDVETAEFKTPKRYPKIELDAACFIDATGYNRRDNRMTHITVFFDEEFDRVFILDSTESKREADGNISYKGKYIAYSERSDKKKATEFFEAQPWYEDYKN